jgi:hypothetical protein
MEALQEGECAVGSRWAVRSFWTGLRNKLAYALTHRIQYPLRLWLGEVKS